METFRVQAPNGRKILGSHLVKGEKSSVKGNDRGRM
jgi:hypothetical protein